LPQPANMITQARRHLRSDLRPGPLLSWVFKRRARTLTCELGVLGHREYSVSVVPHWDVSSSISERFDAAAPAVLRHAEIAGWLQEEGWMLHDHVRPSEAPAAA